MIKEGQHFPRFALQDQNGQTITEEVFKGKRTIIYFYPKDDTPGCTTEAWGFRDLLPKVEMTQIIGVSPDDVKSHAEFAKKHGLQFPLLSDPQRELINSLGLWVEKTMFGKKNWGVERTTFLVDEDGVVQKIWRRVNPQEHAKDVQAELAAV